MRHRTKWSLEHRLAPKRREEDPLPPTTETHCYLPWPPYQEKPGSQASIGTMPRDILPTSPLNVGNEINKAQPAPGPGPAAIRPTCFHVTKRSTTSHGTQCVPRSDTGAITRQPHVRTGQKSERCSRSDSVSAGFSSSTGLPKEATTNHNNPAVLMTVVNPIVHSLVARTHKKPVTDYILARGCCVPKSKNTCS